MENFQGKVEAAGPRGPKSFTISLFFFFADKKKNDG
jgi:hypothetical protein